MESNKVLNNDRKYAVAEFYLYIIICEWLIFIVIGLTELSILSENFIIENKWTTIGIVTLMVFLGQLMVNFLFKSKIENLNNKYSQIYNWKKSNYRKRALLYTIFYFILFPLFIVSFYIFIDKVKNSIGG